MNLHTQLFYLLEQHSKSFKIWSAIIRINTAQGKSLVMQFGPGYLNDSCLLYSVCACFHAYSHTWGASLSIFHLMLSLP